MNQADLTMRAGGERASLPLMRRFNEHSERLLNQSLYVRKESTSSFTEVDFGMLLSYFRGLQASQNRMALDPGNAGVSISLDALASALLSI